jgi:hypothetical protein
LLTVYEPKNELIPEEPFIESAPIFRVNSPNLCPSGFGGIFSPDMSTNFHEVFSSEEMLFFELFAVLLQLKTSKNRNK